MPYFILQNLHLRHEALKTILNTNILNTPEYTVFKKTISD